MMRTTIVGLLVCAALMTTRSVDVAEASVLYPSLSSQPAAAPSARDECQECYTEMGEFSTGAWMAFYEHYESDGHCIPELGNGCVRCNGEPDCEGDWDSEILPDQHAAATWLELNSGCGNCNEGGGGGIGSVLALVENGDAAPLAERIALSGGSIWLNAERTAIQAQGCAGAGRVGLHIAIDAALLSAVRAALEQLESSEALR